MEPVSNSPTRDTSHIALNAGASNPAEPIALTVPNAVRFSGIGRSTLYKLLGAGQIESRKLGGRTLVVTASLRAYIAALPDAFPKREG